MELNFKKITIDEADELANWLISDNWPTFTGRYVDKVELLSKIKTGAYIGDDEI